MLDLTPFEWSLAIVAAMSIGIAKSGFAGLGLLQVAIFARLFDPQTSTGIVLPMLIVGDICSVIGFGRHARWDYVRRLLPPTLIGILIAWQVMHWLNKDTFGPLVGIVILGLTALQIARMWRPNWFTHMPHSQWFIWSLGLFAGFTTMLANAAGPIVALYLLAVSLPKFEYVGTSVWFFLIVNVFKVPLSSDLGLIHPDTLTLNAILTPAILVGVLIGRWLIHRVPQRIFDSLLLVLAGTAALRLIWPFSFN